MHAKRERAIDMGTFTVYFENSSIRSEEGCEMYEKFSIDNFRCFKGFTIDGLERINLFAGENNVGKTALLEAIWLHHGSPNPELGIRLNGFRGITELNLKAPCIEMFRNLNDSEKIKLTSRDYDGGSRSVEILLREPSRIPMPAQKEFVEEKPSSVSAETIGREMVVKYIDENGKMGESVTFFTKDEMKFERAKVAERPAAIFLMSKRGLGYIDVESFGKVEVRGKKDEILQLLRIVEPRLKDLTVVVRGGVSMIWGDIEIGTLLPLQLMGDGLCRWLILVDAFLRATDGMVLIDEIENGIYHAIMPEIWSSVALLARKYNVQVFATTHSAECIEYAHRYFIESEKYDFKLHRMERVEETIKVFSYEKDNLGIAIRSNLEFR